MDNLPDFHNRFPAVRVEHGKPANQHQIGDYRAAAAHATPTKFANPFRMEHFALDTRNRVDPLSSPADCKINIPGGQMTVQTVHAVGVRAARVPFAAADAEPIYIEIDIPSMHAVHPGRMRTAAGEWKRYSIVLDKTNVVTINGQTYATMPDEVVWFDLGNPKNMPNEITLRIQTRAAVFTPGGIDVVNPENNCFIELVAHGQPAIGHK